ncbi:DUF4403 family protein [Roseomonas chloroacetimidivorans]|jgi:hypothetical protein|uniref:DUF4403 family protein n=1 Tax=Roseomonas chloroacetimidivorans TaxID=1766656 RepID=UPI003C78A9C9
MVGVVAVLAVVAGTAWVRGYDTLLASEPPRRATRLDLPPQESLVTLRLRLPLDLLREAAGRALPAELHLASEPGADTRYALTLRRTSDFLLEDANGRLRARVGVALDGTVGLGGSLADLLALGEKNIDVAAEVQADLSLAVDRDWCPRPEVTVSYRWTRNPRLEIVGGVWVNVEAQVRAQVEEALRNLPAQLEALLPCSTVRERALELWDPRNIRVQLPAAPPLYVGIHPQAVGIGEVVARNNALQVALGVRARTTVSSAAPKSTPPGFLPPLESLPAEGRNGRLRLSVPIRAGYDMIRDWLMREFAGRDIPVETPLGTVQLRVKEIFLYPSAPSIALAVTFSADLPGTWLDTAGRVVFSGRPVLSQGGTRVGLKDLRFARDIDSAVWSLATLLLERPLRERIEALAVYDLQEVMDGALAEIRRRLSDPDFTGGLRVGLVRPSMRLERMVPENDALTVLGTAEAGLEAEIAALPVP